MGLWSPDGQRIVWTSTRNGSFDLYEKEVSSKGKDTLLLRSEQPKFPMDWSPDGRFLLYRQINPQTNHDIFVLPTAVTANRFLICRRQRWKMAVHSLRTGIGSPTIRMNRGALKCT